MDEVILVDYDPRWATLFQEEAERIRSALARMVRITRIEHFGSTSIPNLTAKPIIDILLGVESLEEARNAGVPILEAMGYSYWRDNPRQDVLFLVKGLFPDGLRTHHIHAAEPDSDLWDRLLFRDYLRAHPDEVQRYAQLKRDLAVEFAANREAYTDAKTEYVQRITALAKAFTV